MEVVNLKSFLLQDGLLSQGNHDLIMRIYNKIPKFSSDGKRLQVTVYMLTCGGCVAVWAMRVREGRGEFNKVNYVRGGIGS